MNFLIIGAGQLGSRHLQGLLKLSGTENVFVMDPSKDSLEVARSRALEVSHFHNISFSQSMDSLPKDFMVVIVATNSLVREGVVINLLYHFNIKYLILEKVLFPNVDAYHNVLALMRIKTVRCWVNHPRRMFPHYQAIKDNFIPGKPASFAAIGSNWGLGCNGLHLLDIFAYLDGTSLVEINTSALDNIVHKAKRDGYVEFTGMLTGRFASGNTFSISSWNDTPSPLTVTVFQSHHRSILQEGSPSTLLSFAEATDYASTSQQFSALYQSSLTTDLVNDLLSSGVCALPEYEEIYDIHLKFVWELLQKYNSLTNQQHKICPIT